MPDIRTKAEAVDAAIVALNDAAISFVEAQLSENSAEHHAATVAGRQPSPGADPVAIVRAAVASKPNLARYLTISPRNPPVVAAELYPE